MTMIIGLDVGGTHTDVVLLGNEGLENAIKVPTDTSDLFQTVLTGLDRVTENVTPDQISRLVLSTTLTTNAIVQNRVPPVGMIVSAGPGIDPDLYRTCDHYHAVAGSIDHRGREIESIRPDEIASAKQRFLAAGISHVGVAGKFSVRNPAQELAIEKILGNEFERVFLGHRISGNLNFPRRISTTYLNAAVYSIHKPFFEAVQKSLEQKGLSVPIRILKADGGNMNLGASMDFPAQTILSGPAATVMGSLAFAPAEEDALVLDIGGTTTDMAVLVNGAPLLDPLGIVMGEHQTLIRSLETRSIGIGGDSRVHVADGRLVVGPERMGPALAYGGPAPTPTDAMFALGMIKSEGKKEAVAGIVPLAEALGMTVEETAQKIFDTACRTILKKADAMIESINAKPVYTVHEMLEGHQVKPKKMLLLGGPALYFANRMEELSPFKVGVVPRWKVANAIGAALARTTCEVTLFADTEQGTATAPEEDFQSPVEPNFSIPDAETMAFGLLRKKAIGCGANPDHLEMEMVEQMAFNMVRGFYTTGKNIRVRAQVKPGLIHGYDPVAGRLI
jgi:N-methylhydantoinase A/oxoprolinase/acetone carboxylase beta subunit